MRLLGSKSRRLWVVPIGALVVISSCAALGYVRATEAYVCAECAWHETREVHRVYVPFSGRLLFEVGGGSGAAAGRPDALTPFLDPEGACPHKWVGLGDSGAGLVHRWRGIGASPTVNAAVLEAEFPVFLAERPEVLERIRANLRQRKRIGAWLEEAFAEWRGG
jgi:hypothetical protein